MEDSSRGCKSVFYKSKGEHSDIQQHRHDTSIPDPTDNAHAVPSSTITDFSFQPAGDSFKFDFRSDNSDSAIPRNIDALQTETVNFDMKITAESTEGCVGGDVCGTKSSQSSYFKWKTSDNDFKFHLS